MKDTAPENRWQTAHLVGAFLVATLAGLFAVGQAVTFAWLSAMSANEGRLDELAWKFWGFAGLALVLLVAAVALAYVILKRYWQRRLSTKQLG